MNLKHLIVAIAVSLALTLPACSPGEVIGTVKTGVENVPEFRDIVIADVTNAKHYAIQANDALAEQCWTYVEAWAMSKVPDPNDPNAPIDPEIKGAFSTFQVARNIRRTTQEGVSDEFRIACGPMIMESANALSELGLSIVNPLE